MAKRNFLLGRGERLTESVIVKSGSANKVPPYTFFEAKTRLVPMLNAAVQHIDALPDDACPNGQVVASVTMNPEYIAKSYYPHELFRATGLSPVGSRPRRITPEKRSKDRLPEPALTTEFFVMGDKSTFRSWQRSLPNWISETSGADALVSIEQISTQTVEEKIKGHLASKGETVFEVVLHTDAMAGERSIVATFQQYLRGLGVRAALDHRFYAGGLCFIELDAPVELALQIANFTLVRALREMPPLRTLRPTVRTAGLPSEAVVLPTEPAIDPNLRVAIFDGGLPDEHAVTAWAKPIDATGVGRRYHEFTKHGVGVTSAFLFGHLEPGAPAPRPYANVDHYRVLDAEPGQNEHELYEVLERIDRVLNTTEYDFINLSLGPLLPIEDDDVHAWTAVLDDRLSRMDTLATIAVGNDGEGDAILRLNRIQVPSDCVNAVAVGACDRPDKNWKRASYSSVGPGRSPGIVKPDLVDFGGSMQRPFLVVSDQDGGLLDATGGTSFAAPSLLRMGAGIKAHIGPNIGLLGTRTLLVHTSESTDLEMKEVGWGRVARHLDDILISDDDTIRVIYQGKISPAKYLRAAIPVPDGTLKGYVEITGTLCYKSLTDPHHPGNYTRAGLEVTFRPHDGKFRDDDQLHANTASFFSKPGGTGEEEELRRDAWKWENCLHAQRRFLGKSLSNPCFDIHYNARLEGRSFAPDQQLPYALVVTVRAKHARDLYDQVVRKYATTLEAFRPVVEIPVRV
jgi:hypothetical protein